ncbi:demethoxyubiquinone hydroxylase family protein [Candidatus Tisiphia endosymbiont of Nemotelus uliginosus]|uniref:demethoxyubiquinone hydroxylase family protein n=1 Tax=Candidatus Tisiphia endosymbiont of Nemotelus uliginosus TaxID=3077926 RepID=UPI0035C8AC9C
MARPDFTDSANIIKEIIRVNHAGEYGAKRIYQGQLNYINNQRDYTTIKHMLEQEEAHLQYFNDLLLKQDVRPTIFIPFWHAIGYTLGSISALMGNKTAMLLTQGIEEVIEQHYQNQIDYLESNDIERDLLANIKQFQLEEVEHKDIALEQKNEEMLAGSLIKNIIKTMCKLAIILSKKL